LVRCVAIPAAVGLAILLAGSIAAHFKIGDPLIKSFPASLFLVMSVLIAYSANRVVEK